MLLWIIIILLGLPFRSSCDCRFSMLLHLSALLNFIFPVDVISIDSFLLFKFC